MSGPNKYREWILETIDSLRSRKARPDLERICRMVRRRHGSDPDRTRAELEKLIQEQTVLKVSYKGSISYRNAAKVQRKSRKKSEFAAAGGGGGSDVPRERSRHEHLNNNGDSAHSFSDQEEGEEDLAPSPHPRTQTSASSPVKTLQPASSPGSGDGRLSGGATTSCAVGSGWNEETASAPRDEGAGQLAAEGCPPPGVGHRSAAHRGRGAGGMTASKADAAGGKERGLVGAESRSQTSSGSASSSPPQQQTHKQRLPLQPKLPLTGGSTTAAGRQSSSVLGDKLVASVRSLSERRLRAAAATGHMEPLGLKEILGYLSSQERLSEEKLTRGKVKLVMEREVARGRLRRSRCGSITLPLRGVLPEEPPENASTDGRAKSALQDERSVKEVGQADTSRLSTTRATALAC